MMIAKIRNHISGISGALSEKIRKVLSPTVRVPDRWQSSKEHAAHSETARWHQVFDQTEVELDEPQQFGGRKAGFDNWISFPPQGVLELRDAYLVGRHGWVVTQDGVTKDAVTQDGVLLPDHSWHRRHADEMPSNPPAPKRSHLMRRLDPYFSVERLDGTCLSLTSDWSASNYAHFLLQGLPRLELFDRAGFSLAEVDHVVVPCPNPGFRRFIGRLGLHDKVVEPQKLSAFQPDRLLAPSFPGVSEKPPRFVVDFLQRECLGELGSQHRRLYIPRTTTRQITNEGALLSILNDFDFEVYDPVDHENTPRDLAEAEVVVGGHGAGLANLAFCQPGTKVLELIPTDHVALYYYALAEAADLEYSYLFGPSTGESDSQTTSPYDFTVDEDDFYKAVSRLVEPFG